MARIKISFLLILISLIGIGAALDFDVRVTPKPEANLYQPTSNSNGSYFNSSVAIENPGSVGCEFRIRGEVQQGNQSLNRYSKSYRMWPGNITEAQFHYIPINYTGRVGLNLSLQYCDKEKAIESYSFQMNEAINPNQTIKSKTLELGPRQAKISINRKQGLLIPQEYPAYWKVGSAKIEGGNAQIEYDPSLFRRGEELTYTVVENQTVKGRTTVVLEDQKTWYQEILRRTMNLF